jgi:hypothetical protein
MLLHVLGCDRGKRRALEGHNLQMLICLQRMEFVSEKYYLILFRSLTGDTPQRVRKSKVLVPWWSMSHNCAGLLENGLLWSRCHVAGILYMNRCIIHSHRYVHYKISMYIE